ALCLYSIELLALLRAEGHPAGPGGLGENVTTVGIDLGALAPGDRLRLGAEVEIEIASRVEPCRNIAAGFVDGKYSRISPKLAPSHARLYARVLRAGRLRAGDSVALLRRDAPC